MTIIDNAVYVNGHRSAELQDLEQTFETLSQNGGMAWIGLYRPTQAEMAAVAAVEAPSLLEAQKALVDQRTHGGRRLADFHG